MHSCRSDSSADTQDKHAQRRGFTLIEVLVVVAIIALLVAILVPSLSRARSRARTLSCMANCKQIGTMMAGYMAEYKGAVPVMYNWHAMPVYTKIPARSALLSLALRGYDRRSGKLPAPFDPLKNWSDTIKNDYQQRLLAPHWICPFVREQGWGDTWLGERNITGPAGTQKYNVYERRGRYETYHTWLWEDIVRNEVPHGERYPYDPNQGRPKYSVLSWNRVLTGAPEQIPDAVDVNSNNAMNLHRKWDANDARRRKCPSLSDVTVVYCAQGNHMELGRYIWNPESHGGSQGGGTSAVFADTHVDWVRGTQIGWP